MSEVSKRELKDQGDNHRANRNYEKAISDYTQAILIDPNYTDAYNGRGIAYKNQKKYEEAIADYTKAIQIDPDYTNAYNNRGNIYYDQGKYKEAIADYTKAIEIDPTCANAHTNRGIVYKSEKKYEEAIDDYTKAIELDSEYKQAYSGRGNIYYCQGKYEEAIADYTKAIQIDPTYADAYNNRGIVYKNEKKYEEAIDDYTKAIEIDSKYKQAYNNRGNIYKDQKKYKEAIDDYTKAIQIDSESKFAYNGRGVVYYSQGKYKEAIDEYTKAIQIDPEYRPAYENREIVNKKLQNNEEVKKDSYELKLIEIRSRDEKFCNYIEKTDYDITKKAQVYELFTTVMELKDKLTYKDSKVVGHYTKISNLKYLVKPNSNKDNKDEKEARLRLNNVSYMNDPTEGEVFIKLLKQLCGKDALNLIDNLYNNQSENKREVLSGKNHVFLVSFSSAIDTSLPMWVQYSENGEGCCLVFDSSFFDKEDKDSWSCISNEENEQLSNIDNEIDANDDSKENKKTYYCLYQIKYIQNIDDEYKLEDKEIIKLIQKIGVQIIEFKEDLEQGSNTIIKGIIQNILDQVIFLFKDKNYEHEEEVRLVKFEDNGNVKYTGDAECFRVPHVYIELDRKLELEEVILGPKVQNPTEISNYLYYTDKVKEVSKSRIKYK